MKNSKLHLSNERHILMEERYAICPLQRFYDVRREVISPHLIFTSQPNLRSDIVSTDCNGFRRSFGRNGFVDSTSWLSERSRALVLGGSFVFGVGASSDSTTLVSQLNRYGEYTFLNLGIRAANSSQELAASAPFLKYAERILVCSGINNLTVNLQSIGRNNLYGPFFAEEQFEALKKCAPSAINRIFEMRPTLKVLISIWMRRLLSRTVVVRNKCVSSVQHAHPQAAENVMLCARRALEFQQRDLLMLVSYVRQLNPIAKVIFAFQPFADCCDRILSSEERMLFSLTDRIQREKWNSVLRNLKELVPFAANEMRSFCESLNIPFINLNSLNYAGWSFVDRIHMNDTGLSQVASSINEIR